MSKRKDTYRKAFNRYVSDNPRQCIFIGTTNDVDFLDDATGGRRFWIADCTENHRKSMWEDLDKATINQIWAEAVEIYHSGENIMVLSVDVSRKAREMQENHSQVSTMVGLIENYLEMDIPKGWFDMTIENQKSYYQATLDYKISEYKIINKRDKICPLEIWCIMMDKPKADLTKPMAKYIGECILKVNGWRRIDTPRRYGVYGQQRVYVNDNDL